MKNTLNFASLIVLLLVPLLLTAQTNFENGSWDTIIEKAKKENKLVFIDLYFTGCAPCADMDKNVFPDSKIAPLLNTSFISFKADIFKDEIAKKLAIKYGVSGYPTFIFLSPNGNTIDVTSGYHNVDDFLKTLQAVTAAETNNVYKKYSIGLEGEYPQFYKDVYLENNRNISFETVDTYLQTQDSLSDEIPFVIMLALRVGGKYSDYMIDHANELANNYGRIPMRNNLISLVKRKATSLGKANDQTTFNTILEKAKPVFTETEWEKFNPIFQKAFNNKLQ